MEEIIIHGFPQSTYTRTARMAAAEKHVGVDLRPIPFGQPGHLALHPFAKMPAMTHRDVALFETLAIVSYIDDAFPGPRLIPPAPDERARVLGAASVGIDYAYRPVVHFEDGDAEGLGRADAALDWLDRSVAGGYVVGSGLTAADLFFAPMLDYHRGRRGDGPTFDRRPNLAAWFHAMGRRPSFVETAG